ncbi:MAG: NUDIX hydrolase [Candidatus Eremiobacteraeota bacterium]|nr:NUDIX hydrolase [Candidatus Eremiobacteraeota bacterium]
MRQGREVLLVRARYADEPQALWTLPGGRQEPGESIIDALVREFREETSLAVQAMDLQYLSESVDEARAVHVVNCTFAVEQIPPLRKPEPADPNISEVRFVDIGAAPELLRADVLRIPVAAVLSGNTHARYFFFHSKDIAVPFFTSPPSARRQT